MPDRKESLKKRLVWASQQVSSSSVLFLVSFSLFLFPWFFFLVSCPFSFSLLLFPWFFFIVSFSFIRFLCFVYLVSFSLFLFPGFVFLDSFSLFLFPCFFFLVAILVRTLADLTQESGSAAVLSSSCNCTCTDRYCAYRVWKNTTCLYGILQK